MNYQKELKKQLEKALKKALGQEKRVAAIFSGGIDSALLAYSAHNLGYQVSAFTVGTAQSQDIKFSQKITPPFTRKIKIARPEEIKKAAQKVIAILSQNQINLDLMQVSLATGLFLTLKEIKKEEIGVAFSGQGADELFAGYFKLKKITDQVALDQAIRKETQRALLVDQKRDQVIASSLGINLKTPYLDPDFIDFALKIPIEEKIIKNFEGKPIDKNLLRNLGKQIGLPGVIFRRPKKSFQYSTGIQKEIKKEVPLPHEVNV